MQVCFLSPFPFQSPVPFLHRHSMCASAAKRPAPSTPSSSTDPKRARSQPPHLSFQPLPFHPFPSSNAHVQTVLSNFHPSPPPLSFSRHLIPTDDRQTDLHIDITPPAPLSPVPSPTPSTWTRVPPHSPPSRFKHLPQAPPVALVLHGLESNSRSRLSTRIAAALKPLNLKTILINYRSCGGPSDEISGPRLYHAGFTEDLETVVRAVREAAIVTGFAPPPLYLCGFSLGGNIVVHFLGKCGAQAKEKWGIVAAAVACVPFDPTACQKKLDSGWKGAVYSSRLVSTMKEKFIQGEQNGIDWARWGVDREKMLNIDRVGKVDDEYIAKVFGFKDKEDYYQKVDARKVLNNISAPTLIINAKDDPFFDHACGRSLPTPEQIGDAPVVLNITDHGGHCGFMDKDLFFSKSYGYFQEEFARFFGHIRDCATPLPLSSFDINGMSSPETIDLTSDNLSESEGI